MAESATALSSEALTSLYMTSLFDRFIPSTAAFRPQTSTELFALRLAQKLGDASAIGHYVTLADSYSEVQLLGAFRRAVRKHNNENLGRPFLAELQGLHATNGIHNRDSKLISIRVERRAVAAGIFHGDPALRR